jgi:hypothetical protein
MTYPTLEHQLLNVAKTQAEAEVEPHAERDDLGREAITAVAWGCSGVHPAIASSPGQSDNAVSTKLWGGPESQGGKGMPAL